MAQYLKLDPAPVDVDLVRGHLENLGKQTGRLRSGARPRSALSGDADASDFHRLPSQYRLLPGVPGKIRFEAALLPTPPVQKLPCMGAFFKVTIRDHKNRIATVFTPKCRAMLKEPCVDLGCQSSGIKAACMSLPVPMVTWTIGLFACILLGLQLGQSAAPDRVRRAV